MCGIFAYLNYNSPQTMQLILQTLLTGLRRLEYRGYDSAGLAVTEPKTNKILVLREVGNVDKLAILVENVVKEQQLQSVEFENHVGIAHTRWATHGEVAVRNSHPHPSSPEHEFVVIHNGIITNYAQIRSSLEAEGYTFASETDTEVVAKLALYFYRHQQSKLQHEPEFRAVISKVLETIQGAYALVIKSRYYPDQLIAAKRGSPLIMGVKLNTGGESARSTTQLVNVIFGDDKAKASAALQNELVAHQLEQDERVPVEYYLASDINAIVEHTRKVIYLEDDDMVFVDQRGKFHFYRSEDRAARSSQEVRELTTLELGLSQFSKGTFAHYMLKEIFEQEESVLNTCRGRLRHDHNGIQLGGLSSHIESIKRCRRLIFCACGTSYNSAVATQQLVEELTDLPVSVELASDFLDRRTPIFRDDTVFFISQSGETADTIAALEYCKKRGALCVGITNTVGSSIARMTDCGVHLNAGPEIGVASTKAYTSQIIAIILIALVLGQDRMSLAARREEVIQGLKQLPQVVHEALQLEDQIKTLARELVDAKSLFLIGRGFQLATCLEGALKIKEIAYIHSEAIPAGELKHGPLALIDEHSSVIFFLPQDSLLTKAQNALHQITARKGRPIVVCSEVDEHVAKLGLPVLKVPRTVDCLQTIANVVPMQLLAYHLAVLKGFNVDQPRHLAKSVTVE